MASLALDSTAATPKASFNSLPTELKAHIIYFIAGEEELNQIETDTEVAADFGDGHSSAGAAAWPFLGPGQAHALASVALVSRELAQLSFPLLWKRVNLTPQLEEPRQRSTESLLAFYDLILPRHAQHIRAIRFDQRHDRDSLISASRVTEILTKIGPTLEFGGYGEYQLRLVAREDRWRVRSCVVAAIVRKLPRLQLVNFDLAPIAPGFDRDHAHDESAHPDERVLNAALRAIESIGPRLTHLTIDTETTALNATECGAFLRSLPNLEVLLFRVEEGLDGGGSNEALTSALTSLTKLSSLTIEEITGQGGVKPPLVTRAFTRANWTAPLRSLSFNCCIAIWAEDLRALVEQFGDTLESLELQLTPRAEIDAFDNRAELRSAEERRAAQGPNWLRPWRLPRLKTLILSSDLNDEFVTYFGESPIEAIEFGDCTLITANAIEAFVNNGAGREAKARLREVRMQQMADFKWLSLDERIRIRELCESKGVEYLIERDEGYTESSATGATDEDPSSESAEEGEEGEWSESEGEEWQSE